MTILALSWLAFIATMLFFSVFHIDFMVADWLYEAQGNTWLLKDSFIPKAIIHQGGKNLSVFLGLLTLTILISSFFSQQLSAWRWPLLYLFLATLLSTLTVSIIKQLISMECPWDLNRYGGQIGFISLLEARPTSLPGSACFPSGHASAGYAWISLYYFFSLTRPSLRWLGLGIAILLGMTFGIAQQLRGAHFLSHDLWTIMICWTISFMLSHALSLSIQSVSLIKLGRQSL